MKILAWIICQIVRICALSTSVATTSQKELTELFRHELLMLRCVRLETFPSLFNSVEFVFLLLLLLLEKLLFVILLLLLWSKLLLVKLVVLILKSAILLLLFLKRLSLIPHASPLRFVKLLKPIVPVLIVLLMRLVIFEI